MLPYVILHNAVSLDGRIDWFTPDIGLFYELTSRWQEDATLAGSDTLLKAYQHESVSEATEEPPNLTEKKGDDSRPLLVVPDSRGRLRHYWHLLQKEHYWRDIVVLCSRGTPKDYLDYLHKRQLHRIIVGEKRVDLRKAMEELSASYGVKIVRVDSGGTLNGALLRAGLVNEVSILAHPYLVGGITPQSIFRADDLTSVQGVISLKLIEVEKIKGGLVWLRYELIR